MDWMLRIAAPLLLHLGITELVAAVSAGKADAAVRTLWVSVLVILPAAVMYGRDLKQQSRKMGQQGIRKEKKEEEKEEEKEEKRLPEKAAAVLLCFLAGAVCNYVWSNLELSLFESLSLTEWLDNSAQEALFSSPVWIQTAAMGFLVPITEELIFRGLMYRRIRCVLGTGASVFFSALFFALYHGNLIQIVYAFPMALILALLMEKGDSLIYPVSFHMGANLLAIFFS